MRIRVAAYAVILDADGRQLLSHWNEGPGLTGWTLPGGGLEFGEHPTETVVREVREETGYDVEPGELLGLDTTVIPPERLRDRSGGPMQALRILYRAEITGGTLTPEADGSSDDAGWFTQPEVDALDRVPAVDTARRLAGLLPVP
ncbi:NUDIX domain-containing protein [Luteimicrobium xylanilyticum]|uniref:Exodeoxyribonuclease V n=1 Tax=Luteimicrobium xylanilyticum TaxID=1133546 RepID=A0A5P9QF27_9MICO